MEPGPIPEPTPAPSDAKLTWQATVTVSATAGGEWSARVVLGDRSEHAFQTPFELARFFAWPGSTPASRTRGLR